MSRRLPEPVPELADQEPEHACAFCDWSKGRPEDYHVTPQHNYAEGIYSREQAEVCSFCYVSLAAASFLSGGSPSCADPRDLAVFANILLAEIRKLAPR